MSAPDPRDIVSALNEVYTTQGVWIWLASRNRNLGNERPIDLLAAGGQWQRVAREIERFAPNAVPMRPAPPETEERERRKRNVEILRRLDREQGWDV